MKENRKHSPSMLSLEKIERSVGIEEYATKTSGIGGKIKQSEEDFFVEEILDSGLKEDGNYLIIKVTKKNWDTMNFVRILSNTLHISRKTIGYAGTKDKRALTVQYFSIPIKRKDVAEKIQKIRIKDAEIQIAGYADRPLKLGDLIGNKFRIMVTSVSNPENLFRIAEEFKEKGIPNFFGIQRFGTLRFITHEVGKLIIQRRYKDAFWVYVAKPSDIEDKEVREIRKSIWVERDPKSALRELPKYLIYERNLLQKLREGKSEIQALLSLPKNLKLMFIHAYQSYLFNKLISERIREYGSLKILEKGDYADFITEKRTYRVNSEEFVKITDRNFSRSRFLLQNGYALLSFPLVGYKTELSGWAGEKLKEILEHEGIEIDDFKGEYPEFSSKGSYRPAEIPFDFDRFFAEIKDTSILFHFFLPKGCFATSLLRELMKSDYAYFLEK